LAAHPHMFRMEVVSVPRPDPWSSAWRVPTWPQIKVHVHNSARMTQEQQSPASRALLGKLIKVIRQEDTL
jgi:predicted FMN-binding regulatory protein PaiB